MKREEAIKMLKQLVNMLSDDFGDSELCEDALQMAITALQNQPVWIPVSERLPEDEVDVLVWFEYYRYGNYNRLFQTMGISYTYNGEWSGFVNGQSGWIRLKVIAWMPLPEPYRERDVDYGEM